MSDHSQTVTRPLTSIRGKATARRPAPITRRRRIMCVGQGGGGRPSRREQDPEEAEHSKRRGAPGQEEDPEVRRDYRQPTPPH